MFAACASIVSAAVLTRISLGLFDCLTSRRYIILLTCFTLKFSHLKFLEKTELIDTILFAYFLWI